MNTLTYKGYIGSVAFSEKDNVFFGKIEGINGLVNFEGESVKELTNALQPAGWKRGQHVLTPLQVLRIVEYLGEP